MKADRLPNPAQVSPFRAVAAAFEGNTSGVQPIGTKVLVLPDQIADKSAGGILLPGASVEQNAMAVTTGTVVAIGAAAFCDWANADKDIFPEIGQRIHMARYAGLMIDGDDGRQYRLIQDVDIAGTKTKAK